MDTETPWLSESLLRFIRLKRAGVERRRTC
jgi:hypothetical protein